MNKFLSCDLCEIIGDHEIKLLYINCERNKDKFPEKIKLKVSMKNSDLEVISKNKVVVHIKTNIIGFEEEEEQLFEFNVIYKIKLSLSKKDNMNFEDNKIKNMVSDYAFFLLYPTLMEIVNNIGSKFGLPNIDIPMNKGKNNANRN